MARTVRLKNLEARIVVKPGDCKVGDKLWVDLPGHSELIRAEVTEFQQSSFMDKNGRQHINELVAIIKTVSTFSE